MNSFASLLERNVAFAATDAKEHVPAIPFIPFQGSFVITCIDPRVDPAAIMGVELGDAIVLRNVGGRVTPESLGDAAYISYLFETKAPEGAPWFELAVIHHTDCGSAWLANDHLRHDFAERTGFNEEALAQRPVVDPERTVRADVNRLLSAPQLSPKIRISGHVYDVATGLVTTVIDASSPARR